MKFNDIVGDFTDFQVLPHTTHFVVHVVNTAGFGASGAIVAIKNKFPYAYEQYVQWHDYETGESPIEPHGFARCLDVNNRRWQLGNLQTSRVYRDDNGGSIYVCNMLCQKDFGSVGMPPGRYEATEECLRKLQVCVQHVVDKGKNVSIESCKFGSLRAQLDWDRIFDMVVRIFGQTSGVWNTYSYAGPNA